MRGVDTLVAVKVDEAGKKEVVVVGPCVGSGAAEPAVNPGLQCCCSLHHSVAAVLRSHRRHFPSRNLMR